VGAGTDPWGCKPALAGTKPRTSHALGRGTAPPGVLVCLAGGTVAIGRSPGWPGADYSRGQ